MLSEGNYKYNIRGLPFVHGFGDFYGFLCGKYWFCFYLPLL